MGRQRPCVAALMAAVGIVAMYRSAIRPWMYTWGAEPEEVDAVLPGDDLVAADTARTTRGVTIDASLEQVWPWLAQIGEDRGGFYSYSWLERAVGARMHNADAVHPEWQDVRVGDTIWLARRYGREASQIVAEVESNSHLVLMSVDDFRRVQRGEKATGVWSFHLRCHHGWTRLLARSCGGPVGHIAFDIPHFVMEQKMLRGIRQRAEWARRAVVLAPHRVGPSADDAGPKPFNRLAVQQQR